MINDDVNTIIHTIMHIIIHIIIHSIISTSIIIIIITAIMNIISNLCFKTRPSGHLKFDIVRIKIRTTIYWDLRLNLKFRDLKLWKLTVVRLARCVGRSVGSAGLRA